MLSFVSGWAQHTGMHDWDERRPELGREIILLAMCMMPKMASWRSIEAVRGFYTTWTEGPMVNDQPLVTGTPLGLASPRLTSEARTAFLEAQTRHKVPVVLVNPTIEYTGQIRPGVIDADLLAGCWWIGVEELALNPVPPESLFDLSRPKTKAAIRYQNHTYNLEPLPDVVIARAAR